MQPDPLVIWQPESRKGSSSFLAISSASPVCMCVFYVCVYVCVCLNVCVYVCV